ncbi:MAG TPA: hypothetical protein EYH06_02325 [Chromatiales bacterium]|nr:hypothetical protein [Chromatiales bacterium]
MKDLLHSFYWLLLSLLGLTLIAFFWLTNTTAGSRWIIQEAINASGQDITVTEIEGTLARNISSQRVTYRAGPDAVFVTLDNLKLEWNALALFSKTLHIKTLSAERIVVSPGQKKKPQTEEPFSLPEFSLPLSVQLDSLIVDRLLIEGKTTPLQIDNIQLTANMQDADLTIKHIHLQQADVSVDGTGRLSFARPFPLQTDLQLFQKTLNASSTIQIKGELERYKIKGTAQIQNKKYPVVNARFSGLGSLTELELQAFKLLTLNGQIEGSGKLQWQNELQASLLVNGKNLDPALINKDMPGNLALQGALTWQKNHFDTDFNLTGKLRGYSLRLQIKADGSEKRINLQHAEIFSGPNQLQLNGVLSTDAIESLSWQLDAPELTTLHGELAGHLTGNGRLNGSWKQLDGSGKLLGNNLRFKDTQLKELKLSLEPLQNKAQHYQISLDANGLNLKKQNIQQINIALTGSLDQQQTAYRIIDDADNQVQGRIDSQKQENQWQAKLSETRLKTKYWPTLVQHQIATINFDNKTIKLTPFCLQGAQESLCLTGQHDPENTTALLTLDKIPLQRFKQWLRASERLKDNINGEVDIKRIKQAWTIQSRFLLDDKNKLEATVKLDQKTKKLAGDIRADFNKLQWLTLFSDQVLQPQGIITADLKLLGTLNKPDIAGELRLTQASAKIPDAGIELNNLSLTVQATEYGKANILGNAKSGDGSLQIAGTAQWLPLDDWQVKLKISGKDFQLTNLPEVRATASPDLNLSLQKKRIGVDGSVTVPRALILLEELPERAVTISEDARIINDTEKGIDKPRALPVYANIQLKLGDNVRLDGRGLDVRLGGRLAIRETPGKPLQANGKIKIIEGSYTAYGQDLSLEQGSIIFNGPISQPGLDLKAQRKIDDITVGLLIRGTLQNPQSEIFSTPAMPQSDAIAYLLTGKPLRSTGSADGALITGALTKLGVKGSAGLVEEIRNVTGLSTLEIETGSDTTQTALLIGKYLTPQLYVQYVKRLFLESDSLQLRYDINENLKLEAESGTSQGIDLIYQFER